jgi:hypothetical protein
VRFCNWKIMYPHKKLLELRNKKIITTAEYMVLFNWFFRPQQQFFARLNFLNKKHLRTLYCSGMNKIKIYVKTLETQK